MKNIVLILTLLIALQAHGQKKTIGIPQKLKNIFEKEYGPTVKNVKWGREHGKYEVCFVLSDKHKSVTYNADGSVDETETEIPLDILPFETQKFATEHGGKVTEATLIVKADGTRLFEVEINGNDYIFDASGKLIRELKH